MRVWIPLRPHNRVERMAKVSKKVNKQKNLVRDAIVDVRRLVRKEKYKNQKRDGK